MSAGRCSGSRSIGRVLESLRGEFPDITISKIRFLESEGLVTPSRTPSGYRSFSDADVERLRFILTAQRDRFWPLRVIKEALDARDRGLDVTEAPGDRTSVPALQADPAVPSVDDLTAWERDLRLTEAEIARSSGLDGVTVDALVTYGLIVPGPDGHYDARALQVAQAVAGLSAHGLEPRHLRPFRIAADREIGLARQVAAPVRRRSGDAAHQVEAEFLQHCIALHTALVKAGL